MNEREQDILDAALFRLWISLGAKTPGRVAGALIYCHTADDYRQALIKLAKEDRINLPYPAEELKS